MRPLTISTPLPEGTLLATGIAGREAISEPFHFTLTLAATDPRLVPFDQLLGAELTMHLALPGGRLRHFSGLCSGLAQGRRSTDHTRFTAEIVPSFWRLTRRVQSRIFQRQTVPEILARVLADVPPVAFELDGAFYERDYCVQYRESDFAFASRLMEEEGIAYYFDHRADHHRMVLTNRPTFPRLEPDRLILKEDGTDVVDEQRVTSWRKRQVLGAGRVTLRDHTFEVPHDPLESSATIPPSVEVGRSVHALEVGGNRQLEIYQWPGEYARRFDGVDRDGNRLGAKELGKISVDGRRTAEIRVQREAVEALSIEGQGSYRHLTCGREFTLEEQSFAPYPGRSLHDGDYLATGVDHEAEAPLDALAGDGLGRLYRNSFTCIPAGLHYRPPRVTPSPVIAGPQTAVVVRGPGDDEIFTDPYGRVKVKFHWDRDGAANPDSSCWIRVAQSSSGGGFGMIYVPRGGQEVVVQFQDGDPDQPLITGSVYNPQQMPPFALPAGKMISGMRSNTYPHGGGLNEISVDDSKGVERMYIHAQYNKDVVVGNNRTARVKVNSVDDVGSNSTETVGHDQTITVGNNQTIHVTKNVAETVGEGKTVQVAKGQSETIGQKREVKVGAGQTIGVTGNSLLDVSGKHAEQATEINLTASTRITITCGSSTIVLEPALITIRSPLVKINC